MSLPLLVLGFMAAATALGLVAGVLLARDRTPTRSDGRGVSEATVADLRRRLAVAEARAEEAAAEAARIREARASEAAAAGAEAAAERDRQESSRRAVGATTAVPSPSPTDEITVRTGPSAPADWTATRVEVRALPGGSR